MKPMILPSSARRTLLAVFLVLLASGSTERRAPKIDPAPTGHVVAEESGLRRTREMWEEFRHLTPPGVSWRAVEAENRRRNLAARAALLRTGAAADALDVWRERGSFDQTGRTHVTAVGSDGKTLFIGTDHGGVFSGIPGTQRWVPRSDNLGIGVESFVIVPGRPEVWTAASFWGPVYVSRNRGRTWSEASGGPKSTELVKKLLRDPSRPRTIYALTTATDLKYRLYRSDNGGLKFNLVSIGRGWFWSDLWMDRVKGGPLYLAVQRELRKSTDGGQTFKRVGTLPVPVEDILLAGSEAGAPTFYAAIRRPGTNLWEWELFVSANGGRTWRAGGPFPQDFWPTLNASIRNPNLVFSGGISAYRSTDAGRTFQQINQRSYYGTPDTELHVDVPGIDCVLYGGKEVVFFNTDGGTYLSEDEGRTVRNITRFGLGNGQYYDILTSANDSELIAAGAQDQGYQISRPGSGAGTLLHFDQWYPGDYENLTSSDGTHNSLYSIHPAGIILVQRTENAQDLESFVIPPVDERRSNWMTPLLADPDDPDVVYWADRRIWRIERRGFNDYVAEELPHDFGPKPYPELDFVTALAISPVDHDRWFVGTAYGNTWTSRDRGHTWVQGRKIADLVVLEILPSPTDPDVVYMAGSGYGGTPVVRSTDGGRTWQPYSQGLPPTLAEALAFDDPVRQGLYAATQAGPFRYDETSDRWVSLLGAEAPLTIYTDVEGVPAAGVVRFATFGRGIWEYDALP